MSRSLRFLWYVLFAFPYWAWSEVSLRVRVIPLPKEKLWQVEFSTSSPVANLVFQRQINRFRKSEWKALTPEIELQEVDNRERIVHAKGKNFSLAVFRFRPYLVETPKDYEFFQEFSDQSVVMYTGHLNACPKGVLCNRATEFSLNPPHGEHGIVGGQIFRQETIWRDETKRGTYVYFGRLKPLESTELTALIDPALPSWMRKKFYDFLPRLFSYYAKRTGHGLRFKPFVFLNYDPSGEGASNVGGTLPGLLQLSIKGKGWQQERRDLFVDLVRFLAHESAHVWNGQLFSYAPGDMWMHEGGADAFAYFALYELGLSSHSEFLDTFSGALNLCLDLLKGRSLVAVTEDPNYRVHYSCGSMMALITHGHVLLGKSRGDLFSFWHELFKRSKNEGALYSEELYFSVLNDLVGKSEVSGALLTFVNGPIKNSDGHLLHWLSRSGIVVEREQKSYPKAYHVRQSANLLRSLMKYHCQEKYGLTIGSTGIEIEGQEGCAAFPVTKFVTHVNGLSVITQGADLYDRVVSHCRGTKKILTLKMQKSFTPLEIGCPPDLRERTPYWRIVKLPWR